jgi:hypothetical protein
MNRRWIPFAAFALLTAAAACTDMPVAGVDAEGTAPQATSLIPYPSAGKAYGGITISGHAQNDSVLLEKALGQVRDMGLKWARVTLYWSELQPSQNVYNEPKLADFARTLRQAARSNVQLSVTVTNSPNWARQYSGRSLDSVAVGYESPLRPPVPEHVHLWGQFIYMLKTRFPSVPTWSIWNEPNAVMSNAEYYDLYFSAAEMLQNHGERRNVAGPELAHGSSPQGLSAEAWFAEFARGLAYRTDVFTVHTYANEADTRTVMMYYDSIIRNAGVSRPLWNTEANWGHPESNDLVHASRMMRVWDLNRDAINAGKLWERTFGFHLYNEAVEKVPNQIYTQGWAWIRDWNTPSEQPRRIYACTKWRFGGGALPSGGCYE